MGPWAQETRRTLALALPIAAGHLGQMMMAWADTVMIGRTGTVPLAACSLANTVLMVPAVFGFGVVSAPAVRASLARGAGNVESSGRAFRAGLWLAAGTGAGIAALSLAMLPGLGMLGQPPEVVEASQEYFLLCALSLAPAYLSAASKNVCEALSHPWEPFWILMGAVALNIVLNWVLIFGNWGAPVLGLEGAGWATLIARTAGAAALLLLPVLNRRLRSWTGGLRLFPPPGRELRVQAGLGLPVGAMHLAEVSGFAAGSLAMGWISAGALAAHQIALTCAGTSYMAALGVAQATCVRVGQQRGAGRARESSRSIVAGLAVASLIMTCAALVFLTLGRPLARIFTADETVAALAVQLLVIAGLFQILDGLQVVSAGALRGFEDTRAPMIIGVVAYWGIALPAGCALAFVLGWGASGIWAGFSLGVFFSAAALLARIRGRIKACAPDMAPQNPTA